MVRKAERLRGRAQFRKTFTKGRSFSNRAAVLYVLPGEKGCKAGFSAGKKLGGAVLRNRLKRLFREIYRQLRPFIKGGVSMVWIARAPAASMEFGELKEALWELLCRAGLVTHE